MNTEMKYNGQRIFNGTAGPPMSHSTNANKVFNSSATSGLHPSAHHSLAGVSVSARTASSSNNQSTHSVHHPQFSVLPPNHASMSKGLYRINSALDLDHNELDNGLRREFGSVSSIDALGNNTSDASFYSLLKQMKRDQQHHPPQPHQQSNLTSCSTSISTSMHSSVAHGNSAIRPNGDLQAYASGLAGSTLALDTEGVASPRVRKRLPKLWEKADKSKSKGTCSTSSTSNGNGNNGSSSTNVSKDTCDSSLSTKAIFRKFTRLTKNHQSNDRCGDSEINDDCSRSNPLSASTQRLDDPEVRFEEKLRRKAFAHFDCQSLTANLSTASRLCHLLAKRRNTTTGASAASMGSKPNLTATGSAPTSCVDPDAAPMDAGDDRNNDLLLSCPFFRNELGGEEERQVALSRFTADRSSASNQPVMHRPHMAAGLALLEDANERRWKLKCCPYQRALWPMVAGGSAGAVAGASLGVFGMSPAASAQLERSFAIEHCDVGATYYRQHFYGLEHQNWFGIDEHLGPVAISIRRERVPVEYNSDGSNAIAAQPTSGQTPPTKNQYRLIIRTSELCVLRGAVHEDTLPFLHGHNPNRHGGSQHSNHHAKEVLEYIAPELSLPSLRLGVSSADEQLLKLDEQLLTRTYKVGVLYCRSGQRSEEEMYNNEHGSPALDAFLDCIGQRVRLAGFEKYRAGLDNKSDTTGTHSMYATFADAEIMFHVSTMLPYTPNNRQQLLRKRHIGNDIVTIVFQEPDAPQFTPKCIRSHFQHVFIVVRQLPTSQPGAPLRYAVAVSRSKDVPVFGPPLPPGGQFTRGRAFAQFLLAKVINAENAAHRSEKFRQMAQRTRHEYLKELATAQCTSTTLQEASGSGGSAGAKLVSSIFGGARKNRLARAGRDCQFVGHSAIKGAICWEMCAEDFGQSRPVDCLVAVSSDTLLLVEHQTQQVIFVCGCQSVLGWSSHPNWIKIFFHQGEFLLLRCKDPDLDEIGELVTRLRAVTSGCETQEIILRRNSVGQLGFHVGYDGVVSHVEQFAYAWQAGLRRSARIVEICKVAIATLSYEQMLDLLKTSITVSVTVLPPLAENCPRRYRLFLNV
jgi:signal-induced proliferation-associated 1 like protein 1